MARRKKARGRYDWSKRSPKTKSERQKMPKACFLAPGSRSYPICPTGTRGRRVVDCEGTRAAYSRAKQYKKIKVAAKAKRVASRAGCKWAK